MFLIDKFVSGVELRENNVQDFHFADCPVTDAGGDHDAHARFEGCELAIEFHLGIVFAFENEIGLGQRFVIMRFSIGSDFCQMDCAREFCDIGKGTPSSAARTRNAGQAGEIDYMRLVLVGSGQSIIPVLRAFSRSKGILECR